MHPRLLTCGLALLGACQVPNSPQQPPTGRPQGATAVQALVGAAEYHKLEFRRSEPGNPSNQVEADLSTMPAIGAAAHYALAGERIEFGLDGGILVSWESDGATVFAPGTGTIIVQVDRSLVLTDLFFGTYVSTTLGDRVRLYAAAGPNAIIGYARYRDETVADTGSGFGFGGYVRGGVEFRLQDRSFLGVGARWLSNEVDFDDPIGKIDAEGWQLFVTFTVGM